MTVCLLRFQCCIWGSFPRPLVAIPTPYTYSLHLPPTPSSDVGDVGGEASPSRLLSPASSPPVRCPRQRCALLPKQKHSGARRMAQDERLGWQRCAASADQGGAAADRPDSSVHLNLNLNLNFIRSRSSSRRLGVLCTLYLSNLALLPASRCQVPSLVVLL